MNFHGRSIDPISVWERYVDFPDVRFDLGVDTFSPLVQCPNPKHDTLKSHFQINLQEPKVHCFAHCGISGSYEHAIACIEGLYEKFHVEDAPNGLERKRRTDRALREAHRIILRRALSEGRTKVRKPYTRKQKPTPVVRRELLAYDSYLPRPALAYLNKRGISDASIAAWQIGWLHQEKRIAIPAKDDLGRLKFLIKRSISSDEQPKYLYTKGFPKSALLFGAGQLDLDQVQSQGLIVVEGSFDTIRLHQHGFRNTVGILGTGISMHQRNIITRIRPPKIYLFFDKDMAGVRNIEIAYSMLRKYPRYVVRYPKGRLDPAEMEKEEIERQLSRAVPAFKFLQSNRLNVRPRRKEQVGDYT